MEIVRNADVASLVKDEYDYVSATYSWTGTMSNITTLIFRRGGASGPSITTITVGYSGEDPNIISGT